MAFVSFPNGELLIHNKYTYEEINRNDTIDTISVAKYKDAYENEIVPASKIESNLSLYDMSLNEIKET